MTWRTCMTDHTYMYRCAQNSREAHRVLPADLRVQLHQQLYPHAIETYAHVHVCASVCNVLVPGYEGGACRDQPA